MSTDIDATNLYNLIMDHLWCISLEQMITPNTILLVMMKWRFQMACTWVDDSLPTIYNQNISNKNDITTLKHMTPQCLDKPILAATSTIYAENSALNQCIIIKE